MKDISVLIGGKAGDGINSAGALVARLLNVLGYSVYLYFDYPSLIRGGHNFAVIRGSEQDIGTCRNTVDFILALNNETIERHKNSTRTDTAIIFDADLVKTSGQGVQVKAILTDEHAPPIMGNSAIIGGFAKAAGIEWDIVAEVFNSSIPKAVELNLKVAKRAYDQLQVVRPVSKGPNVPRSLLTGNEAIGLGMVKGGLDAYVSYPMTPSSSLLHFLAENQEKFGIRVVHPENEIGVILMALGFAYAGKRAAVGTSGGGFCLMTEGLSLAGMAEAAPRASGFPADRAFDRPSNLHRPVRSSVYLPCRPGGVSPSGCCTGRCTGSAHLVRNRDECGMEVPGPGLHPFR